MIHLGNSKLSALLQTSLPRETLQPSVTSGYTPTSAPQTGYGAPSHNIHNMSGPVTGAPLPPQPIVPLSEQTVSRVFCYSSVPM